MSYRNLLGYVTALCVAVASQDSYAVRGRERSVASAITSATYMVQKGDTLERISRRAGVETEEIQKCNPALKVLKYDTQIRLYESYVVQHGDTFSSVAWKRGMTLGELVGYNSSVTDVDSIYAGQKLKVMCRGGRAGKEVKRGVEPEYVEERGRKRGGKRTRDTVRFPSGLELAVVKNAALIGEGRYFNGASKIPLVRVRREDLFKPISKHFIVAELVRIEEKEERCIDARARPYVYHVSGDYYFTHARIDPELVRGLELVRTRYGKSLEIDEGYRPPQYNRCVGGKGPHPKGIAADIHEPGYTFGRRGKKMVKVPTKLYRVVDRIFHEGGVGSGPSTMHVDTGRGRRWRY